jgi:hypothetical protein
MLLVSKRPSGGFNVEGRDEQGNIVALEVDVTAAGELTCPTNVDVQATVSNRFHSGGAMGSSCTMQLVTYGGPGTRAAGCFVARLDANSTPPSIVPVLDGTFDVAVPQ